MAWHPTGPGTVSQGRFTLYKSRLPQEVYWLSIDSGPPIRCATKEDVQALTKQTNGKNK